MARGAWVGYRRLIDAEVAIGIALAGVEGAEAAAALHQLALAARGAAHAGLLRWLLLDVLAVRIARAADERTVPAHPPHELLPAFGAGLVQQLGLGLAVAFHGTRELALGVVLAAHELPVAPELDHQPAGFAAFFGAAGTPLLQEDLGGLHLVAGILHVLVERVVERAQDGRPSPIALGDVVQLLFHVRREPYVHDFGEQVDQDVGHHHPDVLREQAAVLHASVAAVEQRGDRGCVRRGSSDPVLFQRFHQARLGEARRRLREVLLGQQLEQAERLLDGQARQRRLGVLVGGVVAALEIHTPESVEDHRLAGGPQHVLGSLRSERGLDVHRDLVEAGLGHLRGDGALPDQAVQAALVAVEHAPHVVGAPRRARRTDRLVRFLGSPLLLFVVARLGQRVLRTVQLLDDVRDVGQSLLGDVDRVGTHVGDQTDLTLPGEVDTLVQALGELHGLPGREAELSRRLLLQRRRGEWRRGGSLDLLLTHLGHAVGGLPQPNHVGLGLFLGGEHQARSCPRRSGTDGPGRTTRLRSGPGARQRSSTPWPRTPRSRARDRRSAAGRRTGPVPPTDPSASGPSARAATARSPPAGRGCAGPAAHSPGRSRCGGAWRRPAGRRRG